MYRQILCLLASPTTASVPIDSELCAGVVGHSALDFFIGYIHGTSTTMAPLRVVAVAAGSTPPPDFTTYIGAVAGYGIWAGVNTGG